MMKFLSGCLVVITVMVVGIFFMGAYQPECTQGDPRYDKCAEQGGTVHTSTLCNEPGNFPSYCSARQYDGVCNLDSETVGASDACVLADTMRPYGDKCFCPPNQCYKRHSENGTDNDGDCVDAPSNLVGVLIEGHVGNSQSANLNCAQVTLKLQQVAKQSVYTNEQGFFLFDFLPLTGSAPETLWVEYEGIDYPSDGIKFERTEDQGGFMHLFVDINPDNP